MADSEINHLKNLLYEITIAWANGDDLTDLMGKAMMAVAEPSFGMMLLTMIENCDEWTRDQAALDAAGGAK